MFTLGIPNTQYRRANRVLIHDRSIVFDFKVKKQDNDFFIFKFPEIDEYDFKKIIALLKRNGITTIGADEQLTERKIMKLTDFLIEQPEQPETERPNRMESADDIIAKLEAVLELWERKEYKDDRDRWENYFLDIEEIVEDYKENQSIDRPDTSLQEKKLRALIQNIIKEWKK